MKLRKIGLIHVDFYDICALFITSAHLIMRYMHHVIYILHLSLYGLFGEQTK